MCGDCWNAAMGAPAAVVAARFAWVGYKDRIPFIGKRPSAPRDVPTDDADDTRCQAPRVVEELADAGASPP